MATRNQVYKCEVCGNIVEVLNGQAGVLTCCNQAMKLFEENTVDAAVEKHVPLIEIRQDGVKVSVGSVEHPMQDEHYIEWIEVIQGDKTYREFLNPGQKPEAFFNITPENFVAREYCNLHGLWKGEVNADTKDRAGAQQAVK